VSIYMFMLCVSFGVIWLLRLKMHFRVKRSYLPQRNEGLSNVFYHFLLRYMSVQNSRSLSVT